MEKRKERPDPLSAEKIKRSCRPPVCKRVRKPMKEIRRALRIKRLLREAEELGNRARILRFEAQGIAPGAWVVSKTRGLFHLRFMSAKKGVASGRNEVAAVSVPLTEKLRLATAREMPSYAHKVRCR